MIDMSISVLILSTEILIVGPIPPFLKERHIDANPDAELSDGPDYSDLEESLSRESNEEVKNESRSFNEIDNEISESEKLVTVRKEKTENLKKRRKIVEWGTEDNRNDEKSLARTSKPCGKRLLARGYLHNLSFH